MIKERLFSTSDSAAVKIIGLFLLSDILHNSGAPIKHASNYRLTAFIVVIYFACFECLRLLFLER